MSKSTPKHWARGVKRQHRRRRTGEPLVHAWPERRPRRCRSGKVVNFGFPFETITDLAARDAYMSDVLRFFNVLSPPALLAPVINPAGNP